MIGSRKSLKHEEARIVADFRSRNIVDVCDMFRENNMAYIVMEYLERADAGRAVAMRELCCLPRSE